MPPPVARMRRSSARYSSTNAFSLSPLSTISLCPSLLSTNSDKPTESGTPVPTSNSGASIPKAPATAFRVLNLGDCSPFSSLTSVTLPMSAARARASCVNPADSRYRRTLSPMDCLPRAANASTVGR